MQRLDIQAPRMPILTMLVLIVQHLAMRIQLCILRTTGLGTKRFKEFDAQMRMQMEVMIQMGKLYGDQEPIQRAAPLTEWEEADRLGHLLPTSLCVPSPKTSQERENASQPLASVVTPSEPTDPFLARMQAKFEANGACKAPAAAI